MVVGCGAGWGKVCWHWGADIIVGEEDLAPEEISVYGWIDAVLEGLGVGLVVLFGRHDIDEGWVANRGRLGFLVVGSR